MAKKKYGNNYKNSNNKTLYYLGFAIVAVILVGVIGYSLTSKNGGSGGAGGSGTAAVIENGKQVVNIKATASGYEPNVINAKKGIPLVMNFDVSSDAGCVGGVIIKDYGINQALTLGGKGTIEITPDKVGPTQFSCQMIMSTGTINVS